MEIFIKGDCKLLIGDRLNKVTEFLFDWTFHFIKNKDVVLRKIVNIEEYINQGYIFVEYKDKRMVYYVVPFIEDFNKVWGELQEFKNKTKSSDSCIVMFNNKENLDKVIEKWSIVDKDSKFQLVFANPFSVTEKRWIIIPYTHSMVTEPAALKKGLMALFGTVDPISEKTAIRMINQ
ncbi:hypothetical protein KY345_05730 [Candidatus Woesearchaeota archaeon]|nr:hypothetical protein [Candidatus Woesearchaeota archaeon]